MSRYSAPVAMIDKVLDLIDVAEDRFEYELNSFLAEHAGAWKRMAFSLCRNYGRDVSSHQDEFTSIVMQTACEIIVGGRQDRSRVEEILNFEAVVRAHCRNAVTASIKDNDHPASGMSAVLQKSSMLEHLRYEMYQGMEREPTDAEVVAEHNRRMRARRKNPEKSGMIASVDDMKVQHHAADVDYHDRVAENDPDCVIHPMEGPRFRADILNAAYRHSELLGQAAQIFIVSVTDGSEGRNVFVDMARGLGITQAKAGELFVQIQEVAREMLLQDWGLDQAAV